MKTTYLFIFNYLKILKMWCDTLYQEERLLSIMEFLKEHNRISVDQICSLFDVSRDTARRDLVGPEEEKANFRTRGGAILPSIMMKLKTIRIALRRFQKKRIRLEKWLPP